MPHLTLDASIVLAWLFDDEQDEYALRVRRLAPSWALIVPPVWTLEISNALLNAEKQKRITRAQAEEHMDVMESLGITVSPDMANISCKDIGLLARNFSLTTYDASYLMLAMRENAHLATLDAKLQHAAKEAGVKLLTSEMDHRN